VHSTSHGDRVSCSPKTYGSIILQSGSPGTAAGTSSI